jgi:hypothetical protein
MLIIINEDWKSFEDSSINYRNNHWYSRNNCDNNIFISMKNEDVFF